MLLRVVNDCWSAVMLTLTQGVMNHELMTGCSGMCRNKSDVEQLTGLKGSAIDVQRVGGTQKAQKQICHVFAIFWPICVPAFITQHIVGSF